MALDLEEQLVSRCLQILLFMLTLVGYCLVVSDPDFTHHNITIYHHLISSIRVIWIAQQLADIDGTG